MINIFVFNGGLGNQMFQYVFYLVIKKKYPYSICLFDISRSTICHNGFELFDIFHLRNRLQYKLFNFLKFKLKYDFSHFVRITHSNGLKYEPQIFESVKDFNIFEGFWQTEKWFKNISIEIRKKFEFREDRINEKTKELVKKIQSSESEFCSIHIRRGDYLQSSFWNAQSVEYYKKSIQKLKTLSSSEIVFCFFSDDLEWCRDNFHMNDAIFVNWNRGKESWQDMYLMSKCQHNIIANSSFSWWGAWLNNNPNKIVIAPKPWFQNVDYDILPDVWIPM